MSKITVHEAESICKQLEVKLAAAAGPQEHHRLHILKVLRTTLSNSKRDKTISSDAQGVFKVAKRYLEDLKPQNYVITVQLFSTSLWLLVRVAGNVTDAIKKARNNLEQGDRIIRKEFEGLVIAQDNATSVS